MTSTLEIETTENTIIGRSILEALLVENCIFQRMDPNPQGKRIKNIHQDLKLPIMDK